MTIDDVTKLISELGFRIVIALYLLIRLDGQLRDIGTKLQVLIDATCKTPKTGA